MFRLYIMVASVLISTVGLSAGADTYRPRPGDCFSRDRYLIEDLARADQEMTYWYDNYRRAPAGSAEERFARQETEVASQRMIDLAADRYRVGSVQREELERSGDAYYRKYQSAPAGSMPERTYLQVARSLFEGLTAALEDDAECRRFGARELVQIADDYYRRYQAAPAGSISESAYLKAARRAYELAADALRFELDEQWDFREAELRGVEYYRAYQAAPAGSIKESSVLAMARLAFEKSEEIFRYDVGGMDTRERYEWLTHYQREYNGAPAGSVLESHYRQMMNIAGAR